MVFKKFLELLRRKMTLSKLESQRQTILYLWNEGIYNGHEINRLTNIPVSTVYDNIKKLKKKWNSGVMAVQRK